MARRDSLQFARRRAVLRSFLNEKVMDHFNDLSIPQIMNPETDRETLANACYVQTDSTMQDMQLAFQIFSILVQGVYDRQPVIGFPISQQHKSQTYPMQVVFLWRETRTSAISRKNASGGLIKTTKGTSKQVSIKLPDFLVEAVETSKATLETFSENILSYLGRHTYTAGRHRVYYNDSELGIITRARADSQANAEDVIARCMLSLGINPAMEVHSKYTPPANDAYYELPNRTIFGETRQLPSTEPIATMRFYKATFFAQPNVVETLAFIPGDL